MSLLEHAPQFTTATAVQMGQTLYGLQTTATKLPSERDQNFLLKTAAGQGYVLKIANATEAYELLEAQNGAMQRLATQVDFCPQVLPTLAGDTIAEVYHPERQTTHWVRLVTYLEGTPLGRVPRQSDQLLYDLGRKVGLLDQALADFEHPAVQRDFHWDLAHGLAVVKQHQALLTDRELRDYVNQLTAAFEQHTAPFLPYLRQSVIHNDANDYNVIVGGGEDLADRNQTVVGLIDFGDLVYSYTVGDLAIAIAYAILDKPDPLASAAEMVRGYHAANPLNSAEFSALYGLICLRLCTSVALAAYQQQQRPDDDYLAISQAPIRRTLPKLVKIHPRLATAVFRQACGLEPLPQSTAVTSFLSYQKFAPVLGPDIDLAQALVLDLSVGSPLIQGDAAENSEPKLTKRIFELMDEANAPVAIGRYDEPRLIYTAPFFASGDDFFAERRTIHLGLDLFAEAGTAVYAPLAGEVYALANNAVAQDYGPVILLKHETDMGVPFFTLYGHLSVESLAGLTVGQPITAGEQIATFGTAAVNGNWTPHLHFQIIVDLLEQETDFPGVGFASQREVWCALSPDPNQIVGVPQALFPPKPPAYAETLAARRERVGRNLSLGYQKHLKIERGWRQYLYDDNGRKYLDAYNNVPHVGHCHPQVVAAGQRQMTVLNTNTRYLHDFLNQYAAKLAATLPNPLNVCFFVNSASEANELALRLARAYTGQKELIVMEAAYHGHTTGLIDISPYKHDGPGGQGAPDWVYTAPIPDVYRGPYKAADRQAGLKYAQSVGDIIARLAEQGRGLSGFIAETCPSVGGQIFLPDGYLAAVYEQVRAAGGVTIADEVQTGYGRIGTHFYAFEAHDVVPDIVVLGKPIGNGHPIGAVVTTAAIAEAFNNGMEFFSTFGGNTVSCAVGMAVLDVLAAENLQAHALEVGNYMLEQLKPFVARYPIVGDVRGSGLFLGVELVRDRETLEPADREASFVANQMREHGILLGTDGPFHNVVKIRPPMPFTTADADFLIETLAQILTADFSP